MKVRGFEIIASFSQAGLVIPERKTAYSAGYDIAAAQDMIAHAGQLTLIPTGLKAYMPADEYLAVHIRSGLSIRHQLCLMNGQGIIDADYYNNPDNEGHIIVAVWNAGMSAVPIAKGTRIAQGIFQKYLLADHENALEKIVRSGGFGSTGT